MNNLLSDEPARPLVNVSAGEEVRPAQPPAAPPPTNPTYAALAQTPGVNLSDIYYTLFRHKWKILICTAAGIAAAAAMYTLRPPPYQSDAKLFIRYVMSDDRGLGTDSTAKSPDQRGETIMKSEAEILSSLDLAKAVVDNVGAEKILAGIGGGRDASVALGVVKNNLTVDVAPFSSVIHVSFRHPDPEIVQPVLRQVVASYLKLHVEAHTANGMMGDFLTQETDQLHSRLSQTEDDLRGAINKAGVVSLEDAKHGYSEQLTSIRRDLLAAQAELAERNAVLAEVTRRFPAAAAKDTAPAVSPEVTAQYEDLTQRIQQLRQNEHELLTQFTPANPRVREVRSLLADAVAARDALQAQNPKLAQLTGAATRTQNSATLDPELIAAQIASLQARINILAKQYDDVRSEAAKVGQMEGTITELRRKKEMEEANYRYFAANLEQSRINETLGTGRVSNISEIQSPSPPFRDRGEDRKTIGLLLGGGLILGLGWAFLIELYLDRSIKRPVDIERNLRAPLLLTIPTLTRKQLKAASATLAAAPSSKPGANDAPASLSAGDPVADEAAVSLQPFHETLRDRLIGYFESINLTHKPKLVAVTGLTKHAGVTTTAAGLARSLSETGEGNVLLVNMTTGQGAARQYLKGKPVCGLDDLFQRRDQAQVVDNLYIVSENGGGDRLSRNLPQRFSKLMPKLKASDFDYIIFDMPPVSQISITPRLAGAMDMVLMVIESEKTDRDLAQRATALLSESRVHLGMILNKTQRYVPTWVDHNHLSAS